MRLLMIMLGVITWTCINGDLAVTALTIPDEERWLRASFPKYIGGRSAMFLMLRLLVRPCWEATTLLRGLGRRWSSPYE